jgi:hypothetical protein
MFVVERVARRHRYLYLVESVREGKSAASEQRRGSPG